MKDFITMDIEDYVNGSTNSTKSPTAVSMSATVASSVAAAAAASFASSATPATTTTTGIVGAQKAIEKYLQLTSNVNDGESCVNLIKNILNHQHIYVFGEFISNEKLIKFSKENETANKWFQLLHLFAFGKYCDYSDSVHPALSDAMKTKLRHLTIVSLANKCKKIPYKILLDELRINNLRQLEDLIIDVIYLNIINGKMDQANECLEVNCTISRDIEFNQLEIITNVLNNWCNNCDNILANIDKQIKNANHYKNDFTKIKNDLEQQINDLRKTVKTSSTQEQADEIDTCQGLNTSTINQTGNSVGAGGGGGGGLGTHFDKMKRTLNVRNVMKSNANNVGSSNNANVNSSGNTGASGRGGLRGSNVGSGGKLWSNK